MRRTVPLERTPVRMVLTADADSCAICAADTRVCQHRRRRIHGLDQTIDLICRDKACLNPGCPNSRIRYRPLEEATLALPVRAASSSSRKYSAMTSRMAAVDRGSGRLVSRSI